MKYYETMSPNWSFGKDESGCYKDECFLKENAVRKVWSMGEILDEYWGPWSRTMELKFKKPYPKTEKHFFQCIDAWAMSNWAEEVKIKDGPICLICNEPIDSELSEHCHLTNVGK